MKFLTSIQYGFSLVLVALFGVLGVIMTFDLPPFQVADEDLHWVVALDRSENVVASLKRREASKCSTGVTLPDHFEVGGLKDMETRLPPKKYQSLQSVHTSCNTRPDISYGTVFTYAGVLVGRFLIEDEIANPARALTLFYFARFFHGLVAILLFIRILHLARERRGLSGVGFSTIIAFSLVPLFVSQTFAVSGDAVTLIFSVALAMWTVFWTQVKKFDAVALLILGMVACSTKPVMLPVGLGVIVAHYLLRISFQNPESDLKRRDGAFLIWCSLAWIFSSVVVSMYDYGMLETTYKQMTLVDPAKNMAFLRADPARAWNILWGSVYPFLTLEYMASPLGWNNVAIMMPAIDAWKRILYSSVVIDAGITVMFAVTAIFSTKPFWVGRRFGVLSVHAFLVFGGLLAFLLMTALALYLRWTPEGTLGVVGLQRRYFLPFFVIGYAEVMLLLSLGAVRPHDAPEVSSHSVIWIGKAIGIVVAVALGAQFISHVYIDLMSRYQ